MKKFIVFLLTLVLFTFPLKTVKAQEEGLTPPTSSFYLARVSEILEEGEKSLGDDFVQPFQKIKLKVLSGDQKGQEIEIEHGSLFALQENQIVKKGQYVILSKQTGAEGDLYYIADRFRLVVPAVLIAVIVILLAVFARGKNLGVIVGLVGVFAVLAKYLIPQLSQGKNLYIAILTALVLILAILVVTIFGATKKALLIFLSSFVVGVFTIVVNYLAFNMAFITGSGSEEAIFLQSGALTEGDLRNILFAAVVLGSVGFMVYAVSKQLDIIETVKQANKKAKALDLIKLSLVNPQRNYSLDLAGVFVAFTSASLPILLLFSLNPNVPFWVTMNSEFMMQEIIRILISFLAIVLAVPVTTFVATGFVDNVKGK